MNDMTEVEDVELNRQLPAELGGFTDRELMQMPMALRIWFDPRIMRTIERLAMAMSRSEVAVPPHLRGKPFACASVIRSAMLWRLNPDGVAAATFQTPGGTIGYMGRLCNAIMQASGHLKDVPRFEHVGDWKKVTRKFRLEKSTKKFDEHGKAQEYPVRTWTQQDAEDLGVFVHVPIKDRDQPLRFPDDEPFWLNQCFPLFSTLWATDPRTQICYTVIRRAANVVLPGLMLGVPFDDDAYGQEMRDITPQPEPRESEQVERPTAQLAPQIRRAGPPTPREPVQEPSQEGDEEESTARTLEEAKRWQRYGRPAGDVPVTTPGRPSPERATSGYDIGDRAGPAAEQQEETGKRRGRPPGSKNKPKDERTASDGPPADFDEDAIDAKALADVRAREASGEAEYVPIEVADRLYAGETESATHDPETGEVRDDDGQTFELRNPSTYEPVGNFEPDEFLKRVNSLAEHAPSLDYASRLRTYTSKALTHIRNLPSFEDAVDDCRLRLNNRINDLRGAAR